LDQGAACRKEKVMKPLIGVVVLAVLVGGRLDDKPSHEVMPGSVLVVNEQGKTTALTAEALAKLPRQKVTATGHSGVPAIYEGVALADVLRAGKVALGKDLKGPLLANCLVIEAADQYRVVFSLPEVDPDVTDKVVLLTDRKDGKALDAKEGPYRLVVPHDKRPSRWVKQVSRISVQKAGR
jgi:Oxidoreductase molybdopterin binding domain